MSEFKGTPGPWVRHKPSGYQHSMGGYILGRQGKICDVSGFDVGSDAAKENGKLIAAAPDLLEALLLFADAEIMSQLNGSEFEEAIDDEEWVKFRFVAKDFRKAAAAIAKALGEENE